ncbi:hypothetical protein EDD21DRAFT_411651 [Dissophora ornata]|nr:hypothetical protein EDD21DRAFT_411651 [Dissophora ornata]
MPLIDNDLLSTHGELSEEHLVAIESGGLIGMERLVGATLATGVDTIKIPCVEKYSRDVLTDPHAEPMLAMPSSVPTNGASIQYRGHLKIVILADKFGRRRLVLGVRARNYLVTSGDQNGEVMVGPTGCADFSVNESTALLIQRQRQDPHILEEDALGLAQVRSHFVNGLCPIPESFTGSGKGLGSLAMEWSYS